jgi:hypothetical protein
MLSTAAMLSAKFQQQLLVALGAESNSSFRQAGSTSCVVIYNWTHCNNLKHMMCIYVVSLFSSIILI